MGGGGPQLVGQTFSQFSGPLPSPHPPVNNDQSLNALCPEAVQIQACFSSFSQQYTRAILAHGSYIQSPGRISSVVMDN